MEYDIEKLRKDLIDYFGTAMNNDFPMAVMELGRIERAGDAELIRMAEQNGMDLKKYEKKQEDAAWKK